MSLISSSFNPLRDGASSIKASPFVLENEAEYQCWRLQKIKLRQQLKATKLFRLEPDLKICESIQDEILAQLRAFNFICFDTDTSLNRQDFLELNRRFGLQKLDLNPGAEVDAVTLVQAVDPSDPRARYIPYTERALNWHTDGYYNPPQRTISAFSLYCKHPAGSGGENFLLDHEWVYLTIRDSEPELLNALMSNQMMLIPANKPHDKVERAAQSGPVFSVSESGDLQMRYSSRPGNVVWQNDKTSQRALSCLREILDDTGISSVIALDKGQGLVCNNILHGRHAFSDCDADAENRQSRLIYRARYYDRITVRDNHVLAG